MDDHCVIYNETGSEPVELQPHLTDDQRAALRWRAVDALKMEKLSDAEPAVFMATDEVLRRVGELDLPGHAVVVAMDAVSVESLGERVDISLVGMHDPHARARMLTPIARFAACRMANAQLTRQLARTDDEIRDLDGIGMALMHEEDPKALLQLIVTQGKRLTESDGCGLLLLDKDENGTPVLRGKVYDSDSLSLRTLSTVTFLLDHDTALGHAAMTREPVVIKNIHKLPGGLPFTSSGAFQREYGYNVRSLMVVPMLAHNKSLLGVLVMFNRKGEPGILIKSDADAERYVLPYTDRQLRLAKSLASQAAVSIENTHLQQQIQHIIESLVKAAVSAIDARDPTTAGHSLRVAAFVTNFAEVVEHSELGRVRHIHFTEDEMRELYFSALLHDVGKVGVREDVLIKAKKLPPVLWARVDARFDLIGRTIELESANQRVRACTSSGNDASEIARIDAELAERLREVARMRELVRAANDPSVEEGPRMFSGLSEIAKHTFLRADGTTSPYLTDEELCYLELAKGTLDEHERAEVESHVSHTAEFLRRIPWTDDLKNLAEYAGGHHEKLDGSGYPNRLKGDEIAIQTRLITLADIFDALTAKDRPYKPAVSKEKAVAILRSEADAGLLDGELVDVLAKNLDTITKWDPSMATDVSQIRTPGISA